jgi:hypothetical protein
MTAAPLLRTRSSLLLAGGIILLSALTMSPASAQGEGPPREDAAQIVFIGRLLVTADEEVDTAIIFDGPAFVEGTVHESLVVFNGDVEIVGTVEQDVVVFNGDLVVRSGATVGGDLVTQATPQIEDGATIRGEQTSVVTRFDVDMVGFAGRFAWWLGYSVSVLVLGLLLLAFAPQLFPAVRDAARERLGSSIGWGVGLFFLLPIGSVLLLITVVGIPLGLFTLLALAFIYTVGYVVATVATGSLIMKSSPSRYVAFLVGFVGLRLLALIPFVGGWLWFLASVWGLGLLAVAIRSRGVTIEAPAGPTPPMPPPAPVGVP